MRIRLSRPHARTLTAGAASAALALALVGCGSDDSDSSDSSASSDTSDTSASATPSDDASSEPGESEEPDDGGSSVEVLDPGSGDRQLLELDLEEGQVETTTITIRTSAGGQAAIPPITFTTEAEVTSADDDGYEITQTFTDARAQGGGAAANQAFAGLVGLEITTVLGRDGSVESADVEVPDSAPAQLRQLGDQLGESVTSAAVPLPDEEVGEGARWRATSESETAGVTVTQTGDYTLTSLDGDDYSLEIAIEQDLGDQGSGTGSGTAEGRLTQLAPISSRLMTTIEVGGQSVQSDTRIESSVD